MIRLQQPPLLPFNSKSMSVEIEVLPQEKYYIDLRVRYFIENRQVLELESSISTGQAQQALDWLAKAVKTKRKKISETFSDMLAYEHVMVIEQSRLSEDIFLEIQKDLGAEASPYPFLYDIDVLVNPDPEGNVNAGIGMRFSGLDYAQIYQFLSQLRDEVNTALRDRVSDAGDK
jgi:hypothetical protein